MRVDFIDNMKALGILLVIIGHLPFLLSDNLIVLIYAFHMPLFFFVSGFLFSGRLSNFETKSFISYCQKSYLKPYLFFFIISLFFYLLAVYMKGELASLNLSEFLLISKSFFWATADLLKVNAVLWFFSAALLTFIAAFLFDKLLYEYRYEKYLLIMLLAMIVLIGTPLSNDDVPWNIAIVHICLYFFVLGSAIKKHLLSISTLEKNIFHWLGIGVLLTVVIYSCLHNGRIDLASGRLGKSNILFVINATCLIFCTFFFATSYPASKIMQWLSLRSLVVFPLHIFSIQILSMLIAPDFGSFNVFNLIFFIFLYVAFSLLFSYMACCFFRKFVPSLIK